MTINLFTQDEAIAEFGAQLKQLCNHSIGDVGITREEVLRFAGRARSSIQVKHAVLECAAEYNLEVVEGGR